MEDLIVSLAHSILGRGTRLGSQHLIENSVAAQVDQGRFRDGIGRSPATEQAGEKARRGGETQAGRTRAQATLRELVRRGNYTRRRLEQLQPPECRLGNDGHDLAEMLAVERVAVPSVRSRLEKRRLVALCRRECSVPADVGFVVDQLHPCRRVDRQRRSRCSGQSGKQVSVPSMFAMSPPHGRDRLESIQPNGQSPTSPEAGAHEQLSTHWVERSQFMQLFA